MSHVVKIKTTIKSLSALKKAAKRCGLRFRENQTSYKWYGRFVGDSPMPEGFCWTDERGHRVGTGPHVLGRCDHALSVEGKPNAYEVGVYSTGKPGEYGIIWDWWKGGYGLQDRIGTGRNDATKLLDEYAFAVAEEVAQAQGWMTERTEEGLVVSIWDPVAQTMGTVTVTASGVDANGFVGGACESPVTTISEAIGVKTDATYKPEYWKQEVHLYETNG